MYLCPISFVCIPSAYSLAAQYMLARVIIFRPFYEDSIYTGIQKKEEAKDVNLYLGDVLHTP